MSNRRKRLFRLMAVLLGLSVFPLAEIACRVGGWGTETVAADAFTEFAGVRPLFELSADGSHFSVAPNRRQFFAEESFPARKQSGTRRIFVFGGSTVQGRPWSIPTAFSTFLEIGLRHADPSVNWEVVNCGGVSYASYRLLPIMRECTGYSPDLFIVCTGHNEFLECITYAKVKSAAPVVMWGHRWLNNFNSIRVLRNVVHASQQTEKPERSPVLPEEVDAILDHHGGLAAYTRNSLQRERITNAFSSNLQQMVDIANDANVPLLLMLPPSNLKDCPPFKSEFGEKTTNESQADIASKLDVAASLMSQNKAKATRLLQEVVELDSQFAFSWYLLGQAYANEGRFEEASAAFVRARDEDVCPLRMTSTLESSMRTVASENGVPLIDLHNLMAEQRPNRIVGDAALVDHIHPSFGNNQLIALEIIRKLETCGLQIAASDGWEGTAQSEFKNHLLSLDDLYFLRGQRTLESLTGWTQGRAKGPPLSDVGTE